MTQTTSTRTQQTVRIGGKRTILTTTNGKVTAKPAPVLEWVMQAAAVRALRNLPSYNKQFLLVGGMEAGRRGRSEAAKAQATGLTAGHPDLTIFLPGGLVGLIEYKAANGRLSPEQVERHRALKAIGHTVEVVRSVTEAECASRSVELVSGWLAANDNSGKLPRKQYIRSTGLLSINGDTDGTPRRLCRPTACLAQ